MTIKKNKLSKKEKSIIIDLIINGYARTEIAKKINIKNVTLERLCKENNIELTSKYHSAFIKYNTDGFININNKKVYFSNISQLYLLLILEQTSRVENITPYEDSYKTIKHGEIIIHSIDKNKKATNLMIKSAVNKKIIRFMNPYYNKKFGVN